MIAIGESCNNPIEWFGLTEREIRTTYTKADARSVVQIKEGGQMTITICEKDHGDGPRVVTLGNQDTIQMVFPIPATVPPHETPLETLVDVCERYGQPVVAGDAESKLLISATVPGPNPRFGGHARMDHKGLMFSMVKPNDDGSLDVAFAFRLDATEMLKDL